jgi:hypothetical protein
MVAVVSGDFLGEDLDLLDRFCLQRCCAMARYLDVALIASGGTGRLRI